VLYILRAVEETSHHTIKQVHGIREMMLTTKQRLRNEMPKFYSQELLIIYFVTRTQRSNFLNVISAYLG